MEGSGPPSADPEVSLADAALAAEIARAATTGRGADRAPTLEQLLSAFGEPAPTDAARRRVAAALRLAGVAVRPDLLNAPPGERVMLLPPATGGGSMGRVAGGVLALALVLIVAIVAAALLDGGDKRVTDGLPETTSFAVSTATQPSATTATTAQTAPATATTATPTTTASAGEDRAAAERRRARRAARRRRARSAAAARRIVVVRLDATDHPTFLCVDDGHGHQLFGGTLSARQTFKGRHIRLNIGLASTRVSVNGQEISLTGSPTGLDITRGDGVRPLPLGRRPCA